MKNLDRDPRFWALFVFVLLPAMGAVEAILLAERIAKRASKRT